MPVAKFYFCIEIRLTILMFNLLNGVLIIATGSATFLWPYVSGKLLHTLAKMQERMSTMQTKYMLICVNELISLFINTYYLSFEYIVF